MKKGKMVEKIFAICFGGVGALIFVLGIILAINALKFINGAEEVRGLVTYAGNGTDVTYTYNGEEYESHSSVYSSEIREGDRIKIYVDKENPKRIEIGDVIFLPTIILCIVGLPFLLVGVFFVIATFRKGNKKKKLVANGKKLYAEVTGGSMNFRYNVNGHHPFKLECQYTDPYTGAVYLYSSGNIWLDPNLYIGRQVAVYVDPSDFSKYYVDVDSLNEANALNEGQANIYDFR